MKTVRLITCDSSFQARLILGALENEGIAGILHNENSSNILKGYINNIGVDIFVYEDEYEKALKVLEQNEIIAKQMKYCPYCHSDNIEYALKKEKKIRALFATFLSLLTATPLKTEHWEYTCKQCGKHFKIQLHKNECFLMTFIKIIRKHLFTIVHTSFLHNSPYLFPLDTPDAAVTILQRTNK